ncbi:putative alkylhalidase [Rhodovulum sp. P5]|nr:putative alkylhalidase [Rhodovulum sp. P5]
MHDLAVLGGGPAGAVSAWLAARDGLRTVLIDPCMTVPRIEGLSPRLHLWLSRQGLLAGFDKLVGPLPRISHWGETIETVNREWLVDRAELDAHLRQAAVAAGARLHQATGRVADRGDGTVTLSLSDGAQLTARRVFDARGRKAHAGRGAVLRGPATVSICGWVEGSADATPSVSILPFEHGWLWVAAIGPGRVWVQFLGDADAPGTPTDRLLDALCHVAGFSGRVFGDLVVRDSAPVLMPPVEDLSVLPIGDAAAAGDPLSGHGQFWAVSGALAATAARKNLATRPGAESEALARRFLAERSREVFLRQARVGRDFIRLMTRFREYPFWERRWDFPDDEPLHAATDEFRTDRAVVVCDGVLEERQILRTPASPSGVAWFGRIPAVDAWEAFRSGMPVEDMVARWGEAARKLPEFIERERAGPVPDDEEPIR